MNPKVSIIVPIYNVDKYLSKCIDSIIGQSLKDIEIILVDDGSTDNSGEIADGYKSNDKRIKVIHKENGGQGSARNEGIKIAKGEYIGFIDADDWADEKMYESLYKKAISSNSDITICGRKVFDVNNNLIGKVNVNEDDIYLENDKDIVNYIVRELLYKHTVVTCNKLYKSNLVKDSNILFNEVREVGSEDALFNIKIISNIKRISTIEGVYHNQLSRDNSTTKEYKVGVMNRTGNLMKEIYLYYKGLNKEKLGEKISIILFIFFQQWNFNLIKTYASGRIVKVFNNEHKNASSNIYFKRSEELVLFDKEANKYLRQMGYSNKGIIFLKVYILCSYLNLHYLAGKIRNII